MNHAIEWVQAQHTLTPDKPFFVYLSFGATHAPHHVPTEWSDKYQGKFDQGWDAIRETTLANQKKLGVVPQDCQLTARSEGIPAWAGLTMDWERIEWIWGGEMWFGDSLPRFVDGCQIASMLDESPLLHGSFSDLAVRVRMGRLVLRAYLGEVCDLCEFMSCVKG